MVLGIHIHRPDGREEPRFVRLEPGATVSLGRRRECAISLPEATVSSEHLRLSLVEGRITIVDPGSSNGTWRIRDDGEIRLPVDASITLEPTDALRVGPYRIVACEFLSDGVALFNTGEGGAAAGIGGGQDGGSEVAQPGREREPAEKRGADPHGRLGAGRRAGTGRATVDSDSSGAAPGLGSEAGLPDDAMVTAVGISLPGPGGEGTSGLVALSALRKVIKTLEGNPHERMEPQRIWQAVLEGLMHIGEAQRGFLLTHDEDGGFLLRSSNGEGGLSQQFLQMTLERPGVRYFAPEVDRDGTQVSPSMAGKQGGMLTGVRFPLLGREVWLAYLEGDSLNALRVQYDLELYAAFAAPLLELSRALDLERRGRRSLQERESRTAAGVEPDPDRPARDRVALVGQSKPFRDAVDTVERAAAARANILVRGPSGSGKEQLAQLAHAASPRCERPFVVLNCAALPESLIESELFGVDRGAYTGAERDRSGAFAGADGGTLFLDEIGDLPMQAQAKILRVIETGEVVRVGGSRRRVDVRLVTATHRDLETMVAQGDFREDLYYRLRVIEVRLPPLVDRKDDVLPLVEFFLGRFGRQEGRGVQGVSVRAARALSAYDWPGNVRELRNVVDRALALDQDGILDIDDLPAEFRELEPVDRADGVAAGTGAELLFALPWSEAKERFEAGYFRAALDRAEGVVGAAADLTGVDRRTLSDKIKRHRLKPDTQP